MKRTLTERRVFHLSGLQKGSLYVTSVREEKEKEKEKGRERQRERVAKCKGRRIEKERERERERMRLGRTCVDREKRKRQLA
jgi:hypothetical protein